MRKRIKMGFDSKNILPCLAVIIILILCIFIFIKVNNDDEHYTSEPKVALTNWISSEQDRTPVNFSGLNCIVPANKNAWTLSNPRINNKPKYDYITNLSGFTPNTRLFFGLPGSILYFIVKVDSSGAKDCMIATSSEGWPQNVFIQNIGANNLEPIELKTAPSAVTISGAGFTGNSEVENVEEVWTHSDMKINNQNGASITKYDESCSLIESGVYNGKPWKSVYNLTKYKFGVGTKVQIMGNGIYVFK